MFDGSIAIAEEIKETVIQAILKEMFQMEASRIHTEIEIIGSVDSLAADTFPTFLEQSLLPCDFFSPTTYVLKSPYGSFHIITLTIDILHGLQQVHEFLLSDATFLATLQSFR